MTTKPATHVFWPVGGRHAQDAQHPITGRGIYSGLSLEELNAREGVAHLVITWEEAWQLQTEADRAQYCTGPKEVTAERANDALNCLPPYRWSRAAGVGSGWEAFAIGEPLTDRLRGWLVRLGRRWFELVEDQAIGYEELKALVRNSEAFRQS